LCRSRVLKNGYMSVAIKDDVGKWRFPYVHRLVLLAFVGPQPDGHESAHGNGRRTDNRVENLSWLTRKHNHAHKYQHGTDPRTIAALKPWTRPRGVGHYEAKMTEAFVREARARHASGEWSYSEVAIRGGVALPTARHMLRRESWKHVE
jgi:hypothetical protein